MGSSTRREFLQIAGVGGVVFASGLLEACSKLGTRPDPSPAMADDFYFVQLSDTHWGYKGPANPEATVVLRNREVPVRAEEATDPAERARLYGVLTTQYGGYAFYPQRTDRVIPVFRLRPLAPDQGNG